MQSKPPCSSQQSLSPSYLSSKCMGFFVTRRQGSEMTGRWVICLFLHDCTNDSKQHFSGSQTAFNALFETLNLVFIWCFLGSCWKTYIFIKVFLMGLCWRHYYSPYVCERITAFTSKAYFLFFESLDKRNLYRV